MRRRLPRTALLSGLMALTISLIMAAEQMPTTNAGDFWTYISKTNPYKKWQHWPGYSGKYPGKSPHGAYLELYANDVAMRAAKANEAMPYGAILVKENYGKDKETLLSVTPMYKFKDYNPEAGDWFWAKYSPTGAVMASGKIDSCIKCHQQNPDFRFTQPK